MKYNALLEASGKKTDEQCQASDYGPMVSSLIKLVNQNTDEAKTKRIHMQHIQWQILDCTLRLSGIYAHNVEAEAAPR